MKSTIKIISIKIILVNYQQRSKWLRKKKNAVEILEHLNVVPVLTAHPTQVQRKSMLDLTNHIHTLLRKYRDVKLGLINKEKLA